MARAEAQVQDDAQGVRPGHRRGRPGRLHVPVLAHAPPGGRPACHPRRPSQARHPRPERGARRRIGRRQGPGAGGRAGPYEGELSLPDGIDTGVSLAPGSARPGIRDWGGGDGSEHRVLTGDIEALYAEYLFPLAHICHLSRDEVGALPLADFATYIDSVDAYIEAVSKEVT